MGLFSYRAVHSGAPFSCSAPERAHADARTGGKGATWPRGRGRSWEYRGPVASNFLARRSNPALSTSQ